MDQMAIRVRLETYLRGMAPGNSIWFGAEIPPKKLKAAIESYAKGVVAERVIALYDSTVFGGADEGFLVTDAAFYSKCLPWRPDPTTLRFERLESVERRVYASQDRFTVDVSKRDELPDVFDFPGATKSLAIWYERFFAEVILMNEQGMLTAEDRYVIVQDMSEEFRIEYAKMGVHLAFMDDDVISPVELAEIQLMMTRLELSPVARRVIWRSIAGELESHDVVLARLEQLAPRGAWPLLAVSLVKDLMVIARGRSGGARGAPDGFIAHVAQRYGIDKRQREFLEDALDFDRAVLTGSVKASQLKKMGTDLAAKSAAVGVPLVAVYLSGSVVGLSAAGITSGLAALGFGGVFGLSAMVTGIGAVVLVGVAVYQLVRWLSGSEDKELAALRERLTQEVVKQLQRTVNALIGDIQMLTADVVDLSRQAQIDQARLRRLAQELQALTGAMAKLSQRTQQGRDTGLVLS